MQGNGEKSSDGDLSVPGRENGENDANGTSPKQVAANRRNAMRSTGPRTPRGKEVSKFNATKHGLGAAEIVIPGQEIELQRLSIPNGQGLERLQRYETSIKRDMYRAMDQLERLPAQGRAGAADREPECLERMMTIEPALAGPAGA